ncbi:hypothetical protein R80B4_00479 [Fibrobacteres bacterium R8-0-B4]
MLEGQPLGFDLGGAKRRMFVIVFLFRGETPLKGKTLRKGFFCSGALRGVPAGWVAENKMAKPFCLERGRAEPSPYK